MSPGINQILLGGALAVTIALAAWKLGSLSNSGAWAAVLTGTVIFGFGGVPWAALLLTFFISSSLLSRIFRRRKAKLNEKFSKGSQRDGGQVFANGGVGVLLALLLPFAPEPDWLWWLYAGAVAAVNADTWATELGVLSPNPPRLITTGKISERGTSGAISLTGTLAALAGAALVGLAAAVFTPGQGWAILLVASLGGLGGSLVDSLLGATVQAQYFCPTCNQSTERYPQHTCGTTTVFQRGWRWLDNDWVNWMCSLAGALLALAGWLLIR
jgi:uncharacterized protein (TIGR00297 family)